MKKIDGRKICYFCHKGWNKHKKVGKNLIKMCSGEIVKLLDLKLSE